jgi:hypothetical protein
VKAGSKWIQEVGFSGCRIPKTGNELNPIVDFLHAKYTRRQVLIEVTTWFLNKANWIAGKD